MENDFQVLIQTILDQSGIEKGLDTAQDFLNKNLVKIIPQIDSMSLKNNLKAVSADLADAINKQFGSNIKGSDVLKIFNQQLNQTTVSSNKLASDLARLNKVKTLDSFASNNTKAMKKVGTEIESLRNKFADLSQTMTVGEFQSLSEQYVSIQNNISKAGLSGMTAFDKLKNAWTKFGGWAFATGSLTQILNIFQRIPEEVKEVNASMIELTKVSEASTTQIKNYFDEAADSAKELGSSISDVISLTADFSRLGFDLPDASELADVATLYTNVGDGITTDEASSSLISTMKAFKIEAKDALTIVDRFNEVGNSFAISSGGIGDALSRSASSLAVSNNSLSESIALITAANTVVQDTSVVGTALKTVSLRMTSTTAQLEELGESTEFACETLSDYRDLVMGLTHNKVDILGDDGEYKSTYAMLSDISDVWAEMNSMEQSSLMKALFGVRQANVGASILENFDIAREAMETAENSSGSALREQEAYSQGIQYSIDRLNASWQELANTVLDSGLLKGFVDFGTSGTEAITGLIEATNGLAPLLTGGVLTGILSKNGLDYSQEYNYAN